MTKPKIANGNCLNPVGRLEKRFDEYKRCHQTAMSNCNKMQESHNKSNDTLKALLEKKSKLSDSKIKKKRSAVTTTINRKKPKLNQDQLQPVNIFFDNTIEVTPNVTLKAHTNEIPDIDWDNLDILNNPNFSMSINEHELEGVLNSCYTQSIQNGDVKIPSLNPPNINVTNVCKTSPNNKNDDLFSQNPLNNFKNDDPVFPPLFPSPEHKNMPLFPPDTAKFDYHLPSNYHSNTTTSCNFNPTVNQINQQSVPYNSNSAMYSMNLPLVNTNNNLSYQYHNPSIPEPMPSNNPQYFYQYPNYTGVSAINEQTITDVDNFQLPTMSSGWYNNGNNVTGQTMKPINRKPPVLPQQDFTNNSIAIANYRINYPQYPLTPQQTNSQIQYQQMFSNPSLVNCQSYDPSNVPIANYTMIPEQQSQQQYYYVDYPNTGTIPTNISHNSRSIIDQNDYRFHLSNQTNPILCRNVYQ